jgi:hypothetical protein
MKIKEFIKKIPPYAILIAVAFIGMLIAYTISRYAIAVRGILGLSVFYYSTRFYLFPLQVRRGGVPPEFNFPTGIKDVISMLSLSIVLFLACQQVFNVVVYLIKLF